MNYTPERDGVVIAIRLFCEEGKTTPLAEICTAFGKRKVVRWDSREVRAAYGKGITSSTLYFDERPQMEFADLVRLNETRLGRNGV